MHLSPRVACAAVLSKAVALLLLIYCLMYFSLCVGILCLSLFCYALLCVHSSFAIILKRKRKLVALLLLFYRCIVTIHVLWLFRTVPWVGMQCVIVVFPVHTHLLFDRTCTWIYNVVHFQTFWFSSILIRFYESAHKVWVCTLIPA